MSGPEGGSGRSGTGPSLRDVAREAGVSVMTVSNVVRDAPGVADATRERVLAHVQRLGYRPNVSARHLRSGRSGVIALAVPAIDAPYFADLARMVMDEAERFGWTVLVQQTRGVHEHETRVLDGLGPTRIDGTIFFPRALSAKEIATRIGTHPLVLLGDRAARGATAAAVVVDNVGAAREASQHLLDLGRRRIAAIGVERRRRSEMSKRRLSGYRAALRQAGVPEIVPLVDGYSRAEGQAAMTELLADNDPPDAVFCFSDVLALGALHAAHSAGVRIPEDLAIVGFDDIEDGRYSWPPLTTVRPDKEDIARRAVELLQARLEVGGHGPEADAPTIHASHQLIVRGSTAP